MDNDSQTFWGFLKTIIYWFFADEQQMERHNHETQHPDHRFIDPE